MQLSTQLEPTLELFVMLLIGLFAFGVFLLITTIKQMRRTSHRKNWVSTMGTITTSELETHGEGGNQTYLAKLEFSYLVNGASFIGRKIRSEIGKRSSVYLTLYSFLQNYPVGSQIKVFYDPSNPRLNELGNNPGATRGMLVFSILIIGLTELVGYLLYNHFVNGVPLP